MPPVVTVRYWAGAKRAAGIGSEQFTASTVGELRDVIATRPELTQISAVSSYLVNGAQAHDTTPLLDGAEVDVLPPFAGG